MGRRSRATAWIWLGAVLLLTALVGTVAVHLERQRTLALSRAADATAEAVRLAEGSLNRALLRIESMFVSLPRLLVASSAYTTPAAPAFAEVLRELAQQSFLARDLRIYDLEGGLVASALPTPRQRAPRLEAEMLALVLDDHESGLRFAQPMRHRLTGEWSALVGRKIEFPSWGRAIAVVELPLDVLAELIAAPTGGVPALLTLRRPDGIVLATVPHRENLIARPLAPIDPRLATGIARHGIGDVPGTLGSIATRQVSHRPLLLRAEIADDDALERWSREVDVTVMLAGILGAVLLGGAAIASLAIRRHERANAATLDARRLLRESIDSMRDGFVLFDRDDRFVTCNQRYFELFPHLCDVARPGAHILDIAEVGARAALPDATAEQRRAWIEWRTRDTRSPGDIIEQHVAGRVIHVLEWRTASGGRAWTARDVTAQKRAEVATVAAKEEAEAADRARRDFIADMSRQLRAQLDAILDAAATLRDQRFGPLGDRRYAACAADIRRNARHLLQAIEDVHDLSDAAVGAYVPVARTFGLRALIDACTAMASVQRRDGVFDLSVQVVDAQICSDERLLRQVTLGLLTSAIDSAGAGQVLVEARVTTSGMIRIRVADGGKAAGGTDAPRPFEPFARADTADADDDGRRGRGWSAVAGYVSALGGQIDIDSEIGSGTSVVVLLPQMQPDRANPPVTTPPPASDVVVDDVQVKRSA